MSILIYNYQLDVDLSLSVANLHGGVLVFSAATAVLLLMAQALRVLFALTVSSSQSMCQVESNESRAFTSAETVRDGYSPPTAGSSLRPNRKNFLPFVCADFEV